VFWAALLLLAVYAFLYLRFAYRLISFPLGWDQGEGSDAWSAWLIAQGQLPYSHNDQFPYFSINYPPLWSALVALPMTLVGPSLAPARVFSTLVTVLDALLIGAAVWRYAGVATAARVRLLAALFAGAFFLASPYVFHTTPLSRLNSTLTLFGLIALSLVERPTGPRVVLATVSMIAAAFTKPTGLFTAAACLGWLLMARPRLGLLAIVGFGTAALAALAGLQVATGGALWLNWFRPMPGCTSRTSWLGTS